MKKAFITGISGMDGANLSRLLLSRGYEVHGLLRRHSESESQDSRISDLKIETYYGDLTDASGLEKIIQQVRPDEIYNLGAMSHVKVSFDTPGYVFQTNSVGTFNVLETFRKYTPSGKFYQASSSECFGLTIDSDGFQRESTVMNPVSPYGISKVFGYNIVRHYRRAYGLHACNGILFNHSGRYRSSAFAEAKIVKAACEIQLGLRRKLEMGNLDSYRDIGNSKDYVRAMWMILQHHFADDFVVSTGETNSMRDICKLVFDKLGMNYENYVVQNPKYLRDEELPYLRGDSTKIRTKLGWDNLYSFEDTIDEMIEYWMNKLKQ